MLPTALLIPTGSPVASATISTKSSIVSTLLKTACRLGDAQSTPTGMPRISAISSVTLTPGSIPPRPGLAPCDSLISIIRTGAPAHRSTSFSRLKMPSLVATAEVRRTDLEDEVAALAVVRRQRALARVLQAASERRALVQRRDRVAARASRSSCRRCSRSTAAGTPWPGRAPCRSPWRRAAGSPRRSAQCSMARRRRRCAA